MAGYWRKVLSGAWDNTYRPLKWDRTQVAVVLVAIGTVFLAGLQLGLAAMLSSLIGYLWIGAPVAFAAIGLFGWGILETQSEMYAGLSERYNELEAEVARAKNPPPDYTALRHVDQFSLREAALLWCGLSPSLMKMPSKAQDWYNALGSAVRRGDLIIEPRETAGGHLSKSSARQIEMRNPDLNTVVSRAALKDFAKRNGHDPEFLREK